MKITLEKEKENIVKLNITIPSKDASDAYEHAIRRISQYVNIDGFRKGKAPRPVVERHVGVERIKQEAIENIMPKAINEAVTKNNLDLITQPYVSDYKFEVGQDLQLTAIAEIRPEVTLGAYKDLTVNVADSPIPADAHEKAIENLIKQYTTLETVTGRPAAAEDTAVIDFDGYVNGEKIQGGEGKAYPLDLANSNFIPGFAEQLVGKNAGEEFEINVTFPKEYHDEKLKGQPAVFKIKINEIKEKKSPELNDEFVQKLGPFKTVAELMADVDKFLESQRERTNKQNSENEVFKIIIDAAKVDIPKTMIDREVESLKEEYKTKLAQQNVSWEMVVKNQGEAEILKTLNEEAINRIKNSLVIDKIAKEEGLKLEQKDLEQKLSELSAAYGMQPADLMKQVGGNPEFLTSISIQAMNDKVRDFLMSANKIVIKTK